MKSFVVCILAVGLISTTHFLFCTEPAIPDNHIDFNILPSLPVERLKELTIGKSTLHDMHQVFGLREERRYTYKKTMLPKVYLNKHYEVYRIVSYNSHSVKRKDFGVAVETTWQESLTVTFLFDKNDVLLLYTIRHRHNDGDNKDHAGKYHNIQGNPDEMWPGTVCDGMFHGIYETQRYKGSEYFGPVTTQKCSWLEKLKADVASGIVK